MATNYVSLFQQRQYDKIYNDLDAAMKSADARDKLAAVAAGIPAQDPLSFKIVGAQQYYNQDVRQTELILEYQFPSQWLIIRVALQKKGGVTTLYGFHIHSMPESLEQQNRFALAGKQWYQYGVLLFAVLNPLFILGVLVLCLRTKMPKRKWLWIIFILLGFCQLTNDWTTGRCQFNPLYFQLFGAGAFAPAYGAWLISVSIPLGAICFLIRRKKLVESVESAVPTPAEPADQPS